eukprot:192446_1
MSPKKKHNVIIFVHAFKISSFTALKSLLPNGLIRDTPISDEESKRLNAHINRDKLRKVIKDQDRILVICIMGDCRDNLDLLHPKCMKASNWVSKHIPNCHSDAIRTTLEHEILIHSFFDVLGTSVFKNIIVMAVTVAMTVAMKAIPTRIGQCMIATPMTNIIRKKQCNLVRLRLMKQKRMIHNLNMMDQQTQKR